MVSERSDIVRDTEGFETPDIHSSSPEYQSRFSGAVGAWFVDKQQRGLLSLLRKKFPTVLDAGGGHGQNVFLLDQGHIEAMTVLGSNSSCFNLIERDAGSAAPQCVTGPLTAMPFDDNVYDLALSFRMLTHLEAWRDHIDELCRVSNSTVCVEFPVNKGVNRLSSLLFAAKKGVEKTTRPYTLFDETDIISAFERNGYDFIGRVAQYCWPMAIHRMIGHVAVAKFMEMIPACLGLPKLFGSPVIACFEKRRTG